jgi:sugar O-acyltransferase (sialic acid O-acetyltransferase NeuD family)
MTENKIVLIGGGGHCASVIDVIEQEGRFSIAGIADKKNIGSKVSGYTIIASDDDLERLTKEYSYFLITVGHIQSNEARVRLFEELQKLGGAFPAIISPRAYVSKYAIIGQGSIVMHNAFVNANATVGRNSIINTAAVIEHDATIGNNCHVSTGAIVNGGCSIGNNTFVGSNATIKQYLSVASNVIIGAGAVVLENLSANTTYVGNPAKAK